MVGAFGPGVACPDHIGHVADILQERCTLSRPDLEFPLRQLVDIAIKIVVDTVPPFVVQPLALSSTQFTSKRNSG